ncbi:MAG: DUF3224 domain-containing protein [Thermoanaerobaculia bacterium]|nr:MAG: DUF3224 domain-containing protein [Thermoanaerobaculia bacterium]MBZ0101722.1 DUF3224 domain-containing protein [Thermoanaerobaculia bacterium]
MSCGAFSGRENRRGRQQLTITVVSDSGTGALTGVAATFRLEIVDGEHRLTLEPALPD